MLILANILFSSCAGRFWAATMALVLLAAGVAAQETSYPEPQVKAAFLLNFPKYVDWPAGSFASTNSPIVIAVFGDSPVTAELQNMIAGRSVGGRKIALKLLAAGETPGLCHILFVTLAEQAHETDVLASIQGKDILTVGESGDFLKHGGIIKMTLRDGKIALQINLAAAERSRLKISSKLLNVAGKVNVNPS